MDVTAVSTLIPQAGQSQAVQLRLMAMNKDQAVEDGQQLVQMMERSVQPHLGRSIDVRL